MKALIAVTALAVSCFGQGAEPKYEMDHYVVGLLRRGPKWTKEPTPDAAKLQEGHMANIRRMAAMGKLVVAGPFTDGGELRGMFIFNATMDEAKELVSADPAVKAGRLAVDLHRWFAGKGLAVAPPVR